MNAGADSQGDWIAGLRLLQARHAAVPELLRAALAPRVDPQEIADSIAPGGVVTTGAGSSAAHARFLASVLSELGVPASFAPLTSFVGAPGAAAANQTLVVFSQGLSPNARLALQHVPLWHSAWLATAVGGDVAGSEAPPGADEDARRRAVEEAISAGVRLLPYPGANEFGTLLRILGPMAGYAAALRFAGSAGRSVAHAPWQDVGADEICRVVAGAGEKLARLAGDLGASELDRNLVLLASGAHSERVENLRLKFLEGTWQPAPPVWDLLDLAHGPFQQLFAGRATLIALARADADREGDLLSRAESMLDPGRHRLVRLTAELPGPLAIFEHEALMNELVLRYISERRIDPCNWPGKGADSALYSFGAAGRSAPAEQPRASRETLLRTRRLEDLTWPEVETFLAPGGRTAILPLGSIEQHGPHLPFATDAWIAGELARRLRSRLPEAIELPVLSFGCAGEHLAFPGTLSLGDDTLARVLCDLAASVARHGFARLFVFSAHGGNRDALAKALPRMRAVAGDLAILAAPGLGASMDLFHNASAQHGVSADASGHHAGEFETSILMAIAPQQVRTGRLAPGLAAGDRDLDQVFYPDLRASAPNGTVGDPRGADASRAEAYLEAWVGSLLEIYRREDNWK
ncbi:MAG: creatininase family protein [Candidatus Binatia bacterium]